LVKKISQGTGKKFKKIPQDFSRRELSLKGEKARKKHEQSRGRKLRLRL